MGTPLKNNQHKNINNASQELLFKYTSLTGLCLFCQFKFKRTLFFPSGPSPQCSSDGGYLKIAVNQNWVSLLTAHPSIIWKAAAAMFSPTDADRPLEGQKHGIYPVIVESLEVNGHFACTDKEITRVNITEHLNISSWLLGSCIYLAALL